MTNTETIFPKCFKVTFPQNVFIIPFEGNLTESKKENIATKLQAHLNETMGKQIPVANVKTTIFKNMYGRIEKSLKMNNRGERIDISAKGWASNNCPSEQIVVLH